MKRHNVVEFEEHPAGEDSRNRQKELIADFEEIYQQNCKNSNRKLTNTQNTALFIAGTMTRLLLPPRTHHADCVKRVGNNMYVQIKK